MSTYSLKLCFSNFRKETLLCLLVKWLHESSLFWKQAIPFGSLVRWKLPDPLWGACLEFLAQDLSYSCILDQRSLLLHRAGQSLPPRVQFLGGHIWNAKKKGNSYLDSPASWLNAGNDGVADVIPDCLIYTPNLCGQQGYTTTSITKFLST